MYVSTSRLYMIEFLYHRSAVIMSTVAVPAIRSRASVHDEEGGRAGAVEIDVRRGLQHPCPEV
jgi:hypothetical protein